MLMVLISKTCTPKARETGVDVFRVFDSLNYLPNLKVAMKGVCLFPQTFSFNLHIVFPYKLAINDCNGVCEVNGSNVVYLRFSQQCIYLGYCLLLGGLF